MNKTMFEQLGGMAVLQRIVDVFVDRVFDDVMIGYLFRHVDKKHIKAMETQFAAEFFGANIKYKGRNLKEAHAIHKIKGGEFARRKQILSDVLDHFQVEASIKQAWLDHTESLRAQITGEFDKDC